MNLGMGGHQSHRMKSADWLTPPEVLQALGPFDLDPCASPLPQPWRTAKTMWTEENDGFSQKWFGRVWLNPPYGQQTWAWLQKLAKHGDGCTLIFARTETVGFQNMVFGKADGLLFLAGRLHFHRPDGTRAKANSGAPSVIIAYGERNVKALAESGLSGYLIRMKTEAKLVP